MGGRYFKQGTAAGQAILPRSRRYRGGCPDDRQAALPLDEPPPLDKHGLLLAALPDTRLRSICDGHERDAWRRGVFHGRPVPGDRFHVTLFFAGFLGSLPPPAVAYLADVIERFRFEPIPVIFDEVVSNGRHLLLTSKTGGTDVDRFARRLRRALGEASWPWPVHHRFSPHLTLGYGPCRPSTLPVAPVEATILRMRMLHSLHGEGMHRHPIGGPDGPDIVLTSTDHRSATRGITLHSDAPLFVDRTLSPTLPALAAPSRPVQHSRAPAMLGSQAAVAPSE